MLLPAMTPPVPIATVSPETQASAVHRRLRAGILEGRPAGEYGAGAAPRREARPGPWHAGSNSAASTSRSNGVTPPSIRTPLPIKVSAARHPHDDAS